MWDDTSKELEGDHRWDQKGSSSEDCWRIQEGAGVYQKHEDLLGVKRVWLDKTLETGCCWDRGETWGGEEQDSSYWTMEKYLAGA